MKAKVIDIKGKNAGDIELKDEVFGADFAQQAVYLDIKQHLANKRQGTHKSKERGEVVGSTRKIKKQKGTGTARAGDIKSPIFRGGGRIFGPKPRNYSFKLNKKLKKVARKSALSAKHAEKAITFLDTISMDAPKTKAFVEVRQNLKLNDKKLLLVLDESNKNVYLSARNLQGVKVVLASGLNTYDIMNAQNVVMTKKSVDVLHEILS